MILNNMQYIFLLLCRRKVEIMHTHSLFTLLGERLMMHTNTVSITTYNTLYEVGNCDSISFFYISIQIYIISYDFAWIEVVYMLFKWHPLNFCQYRFWQSRCAPRWFTNPTLSQTLLSRSRTPVSNEALLCGFHLPFFSFW